MKCLISCVLYITVRGVRSDRGGLRTVEIDPTDTGEPNIDGHAQSKTGLDPPGILKSAFERAPEQQAMKVAYSAASGSAGPWSTSTSFLYAERECLRYADAILTPLCLN